MPVRTKLCYKIQFPDSFISIPYAYLILNLPSCHYSTCFPTIFFAFFTYPIWATIKIMLSTMFIVFRGEHKTALTHTDTQTHVYQPTEPGMHTCTHNFLSHCSKWIWCTIPCAIIILYLKIFTLQMFYSEDLAILNFPIKCVSLLLLEIILVTLLIPDYNPQ
jgi:hypothetical protein